MGPLAHPGCGSHVGITEWLQDGKFAAVPPAEDLRVINIQHTAVEMNSQKGLSSFPSFIREDSEGNRN